MRTIKSGILFCLFISISSICQAQWLNGTNGIYYNGNVGIGTSTLSEKFELNGNFIQSPNKFLYLGHVGTNDTRLRISTNDLYGAYMDYSHALYVRTANQTNIMTFLQNGNVGIGTSTPNAKLELNGSFIQSPNNILYLGHVGTNDTRLKISTNNLYGAYMDYSHALYVRTANQTNIMTFLQNGNVGIGASNPTVKLDVTGVVRAHEVKVCLNQGCDYVFDDDYELMNLNDLSFFIKTNKHLPDVAPAAQMEEEGINLSEMNALLLKKVEELTLYILQQEERIKALEEAQ